MNPIGFCIISGLEALPRGASTWASTWRKTYESYWFLNHSHDRLQVTFAGALKEAGFNSWIGELSDTTDWLVKTFGDVSLHETVISHIRRLLDTDFSRGSLHETPIQFRQRMQKIEDFMNSLDFAAHAEKGLKALAKDLLP